MKEILKTSQYNNSESVKNNRIAAGTIFFIQVAIIFLYGFFVIPTPTAPNQYDQELFVTVGVAILVLIGFGLIFSIAQYKIWSSLGFTLLITALTFQLYFLVSGFWTNVNISQTNKTLNWSGKLPVFLTDSNTLNVQTYGMTAVQAFKCALANSIAFAAIGGRAGPLQALIITFLGTVLYQLNRQLVSRFSLDMGGSMTIFCFGGFLGSTISIILYHCRQKETFHHHQLRKSGKFSYLFGSIGSLFCWVFFPLLNIDIPTTLIYNYTAAISTLYSISACVLCSVSLSCIINGMLDLKHLLLSPVVGGVAVGSSAAFINNNVGSLLVGVGASIISVGLLQLDKQIRWSLVVQNYVIYIYAVIGACGGLISAFFSDQASLDTNFTNLSQGFGLQSPTNQLIGVGISAGIGVCGGLFLSILICWVSVQTKEDHYHDRAYWITQSDGISSQQSIDKKKEASQEQEQSEVETVYMREMMIKQPKSDIVSKYAYL